MLLLTFYNLKASICYTDHNCQKQHPECKDSIYLGVPGSGDGDGDGWTPPRDPKRRVRCGYTRALDGLVRIVTAIANIVLTSKNVAVWSVGERIVRNGVYAQGLQVSVARHSRRTKTYNAWGGRDGIISATQKCIVDTIVVGNGQALSQVDLQNSGKFRALVTASVARSGSRQARDGYIAPSSCSVLLYALCSNACGCRESSMGKRSR